MEFYNEDGSRFEEVEDMITLSNLTEESLLTNLQIRYAKRFIYTYTGSILVAVNPYEVLPIYTPDIVKSYFGKQRGSLPPHIFAIADAAYTNMMEERRNQSIIISGESGAGKTESTKLIIQYLAARTNKHSQVEQMIVESSPILEAFGNAKTVRNNNSSRFGKFIEIQFNTQGHICGARIINYLLEKSRISSQAKSERNYHIFYQLIAGASQELKTKLKLGEAEDYHYLNQSGCINIDRINDAEDFEHVRYAMSVLGMPEDRQNTIFTILGAILHLGNVTFEKCEKTQGAEGSKVLSRDTLKIVADLLSLDPGRLETCLTMRHVFIRGQNFEIPLKVGEAEDARDTFSKSLYGNVFNWLVTFINSRIHKPQPNTTFIGVLDIFGFENFKKNSFEQFCINFANEKLQQHFNQHIFKLEQEEYEKEKINWSKIKYNDNQECLDLIEKRPLGILSLLDEECRFPQATDSTLLEKLHSNHEKHHFYEKPKLSKTSFGIKHYAGEVSYDVASFLDKNKDTISDDMLSFMQQCKNKFLVELFTPPKDSAADDEDGKGTMKKQVRTTAGSQFKTQLGQLVATLSATAPHYVRCIKPNSTKEPSTFDPELIQAQLRYAGMMETIRIRKTGYPIRLSVKEFRDRYLLLEWRARDPAGDIKKTANNLINLVNMSYANIDASEWQMGTTKVFIRDPQYRVLEELRKEKLIKKVVLIQSAWRMFRLKKKYQALRKAAVLLQTAVRSTVARKELGQTKAAATRIQASWKMYKTRRDYLCTKESVALIQTEIRGFLARKRTAELVEVKRDRLRRLAEIQAEKDSASRSQKEKEERDRQAKEDAARVAQEKKVADEERRKRDDEERAKRADEEAKRAQEKTEQLKELKQFDELSSLENMLRQQQQNNINELDSLVFSIEAFTFEGGVDESAPYTYNSKMYEMGDDALDKISLTDLLQGLKQTVKSVTKLDVDDSKFDLPPGIENVLKRLPQPTPIKNTPSSGNLMVNVGSLPPPPPPVFMDDDDESGSSFMPPPPPLLDGMQFSDAGDYIPPPPPPMFDPVLGAPPPPPMFDPILGAPPPPPPTSATAAAGGSAKQAGSASQPQSSSQPQKPVNPAAANLKPIILDEEISLFSFYDYARKNFASSDKAKNKDDLYAYQKSYIKHALLTSTTDSEVAKAAVDAFSRIHSYLSAPSGKKEDTLFTSIKYLLSKGLAMEGLRDELYCQLVKQSISPPTLEIKTRAWELLHFASATFLPSKKLIKYVASYMRTTANTEAAKSIKDMAIATYTTMQRNIKNGGRKLTPSTQELEALKDNRPLFVRVSMCDGSLKGLTIDSATTCTEAVDDLCHRARIRPAKASGFALLESFNGIERDLAGEDKIADVLSRLESLQSSKLQINFKLLLKKRLFAEFAAPEDIPQTEVELVFHQTYADFLLGGFVSDNEFLLHIGALKLQADSGDYTEDVKNWLPGNGRGKYFSAATEKNKFEEFISKYRALKGTTQEDAKTQLYEQVLGHPLANQTLFECEHNVDGINYPKKFILTISIQGVAIYDPANTKASLNAFKFSQVATNALKLAANNKSITIPLPDMANKPFEVQHADAPRILALYKEYSNTLRNNAKYARALRDYFVNDETLLPFRRGDIITIVLKDQENKWYIGQLNGKEGSFPVDHVEILLVDNVSNIPAAPAPAVYSPAGASSPALSGSGNLPPPPPQMFLGKARSSAEMPPPPPPSSASGLSGSGGVLPPPPSFDMPPPPPQMLMGKARSSVEMPPPPPPSSAGGLSGSGGLPPPPVAPVLSGPPPPMLSTPPPPMHSSPSLSSGENTPPPPPPVVHAPVPSGPPPAMLSTPNGVSPKPSRLSMTLASVSSPPPPPPTVQAGPAPPMLATPTMSSPTPSRLSTPPPTGVSTPPPPPPQPSSSSEEDKRVSRIQTMAPLETASPLEPSMMTWANNKFRSFKRLAMAPATATLKKKPVDPNFYVCFTKDPIKESLLDLETSKLSKRAVLNFTSVMTFMGDYPLPKGSNLALVAQEIVLLGIQSPELRDEVFCQIYRQTNRNPRQESVRRAFELISFLATSFTPSESLMAPFVEQLMARHIAVQAANPSLSTLINKCIERLESHPLSSAQQRKYGPSTAEINSLRSEDAESTVNVRAVNQTTVACIIDSYTNVKDVATSALHQLGVSDAAARNFGLYQVNEAAGICRPLGDGEIIYDIMSQWEQWAMSGENKHIVLDNFYLQIRRKYFVDDITRIVDQEHLWTNDETSFDLTYTQLREEWIRGVYTLSDKDASAASAILVQLAHPNQSRLQLGTKEALRPFMPESIMSSQNTKYWASEIESLLFEMVSHTPEYLKLLFIQTLGKCPLFGCTLFVVQPKEGTKAILGVSKKGVYLFDIQSKETKNYWTFQSISNWSFTDSTFIIMTGNLMKPVKNTFVTTDYSAISSCYQFYNN
ncbi:class VII unconventional myosin [Cavenderia fasciculata]|uniref:Class VII unconventional myosin n=1 Tax=Cavenderia fasciculata TaxID=261658 RepID=F4PGT3_CACFS|nr:class VII unconventional myosin [Cavenderia fasciculata]EGG24917.1 class VII unconventional myosin [Cavenderia fasciculata]|eukprot:XP_004362768.1 class VII unconventional myosin [Cavenderia fasciculata]